MVLDLKLTTVGFEVLIEQGVLIEHQSDEIKTSGQCLTLNTDFNSAAKPQILNCSLIMYEELVIAKQTELGIKSKGLMY